MKLRLIFLSIFTLIIFSGYSQDCLNTGQFQGAAGWGLCTPMSNVLGNTKVFTTQASAAGNSYFRFYGDGVPCGEYGPVGDVDVFFPIGVAQSLNCVGGAGKAYYINAANTSWNYVFKAGGVGASNPNEGRAVVFEVQGPVQSVTNVSQPSSVLYLGQSYTVTVTLSGALSAGQGVYLRYSTDNFATSSVVGLTGSGTTYTYTIPAQVGNTTVLYYAFTSGAGLSIAPGDAPLYSINLSVNGDAFYYGYSVVDFYLANTNGNWSTGSTWANGAMPPSGSNVAIAANVTADVSPNCVTVNVLSGTLNTASNTLTCEGITIESGATVDLSTGNLSCKNLIVTAGSTLNGASGILTITTGGRIQTSGQFNSGSGKVVFEGTGELSGGITFNDVDIHGGVDFRTSHFGAIGVATINGTLSIKTGGYVSTAYSPKYGPNSLLEYNTGGNYNAFNEWNSSWGILDNPHDVLVTNGTALRITTGRLAYGNVTVTQNGLISLEGADPFLGCKNLYVEALGTFESGPAGILSLDSDGLLSNNGTFNAGTGKVLFGGPGSISGTITLYNVDVKNGNVDFGSGSTVNGTLSIKLQGLVFTNGPQYGPTSTLEYISEYITPGSHTAYKEWEYTPNNVVLVNTTLTFPNNTPRAISGLMTVQSGCTFEMSNLSPFSCGDLLIQSGATLNAADGSITINDGGALTNNGTFNAGTGKVVFGGAGTATGTFIFNHVDISGAVDFGNNATVNGIFSIKTGGSINTNPPVYSPNATLEYATGGTYTSGIELRITAPPGKLIVTNNTALSLSQQSWVAGDVTINAGSSINAGYSFTIDNSLVNNGTLTLSSLENEDFDISGNLENNGTINTNGRLVFFYGITNQTISGSVPPAFGHLVIDNPTTVTLNCPIRVVHELYLTQGRILLGNNDLTLGSTAAVYIGNVFPSYAVTNGTGGVVNEVPAEVFGMIFPIGSGTTYHPAFIDFVDAPSAGGTLKGRFVATNPGTNGLPIAQGGINISSVSPSGYWEINAGAGLTGGVYDIGVDASGFTQHDAITPITDMSGIRLIKRTSGGNWVAAGTGIEPIGLDYISIEGVSGFSDFAIGGTEVALPVELTAISAYSAGLKNVVEWQSAQEIDLKAYVVQRCTIIGNWQEIGVVEATGAGNYTFADEKPLKGGNYYRLQMLDNSGRVDYSKMVFVNNAVGHTQITALPNPVINELTVWVTRTEEEAAIIQITDVLGRVVYSEKRLLQKGNNQFNINVEQLASGVYFFSLNEEVIQIQKSK